MKTPNMLLQLTFLVAIATPLLHADIKILNTPTRSQPGPEPCSRICSGVSWWGSTGFYNWKRSSIYRNKLVRPNDMRECGFVSAPLVTATAGGNVNALCPSVSVSYINERRFDLYTVEDTTLDEVAKKGCNIYWTASGFTC